MASLILVALILSLLFSVLCGANSSTLAVVRHSEGARTARGAAESLLARAIFELRHDTGFGNDGQSLEFLPKDGTSGTARLTFDPLEAKRLGIPVSINNLDNAESVQSDDGELVPARTARVVAAGRFFDDKRTVVMDLHIPPFPYAVATDGTFVSPGHVSLTGLDQLGREAPAHLRANGLDGEAVTLGEDTTVSGDVVSASGIHLADAGVVVKGEVLPYSQPVALPRIDVRSFDPRFAPGGDPVELSTSYYQNPVIEGRILRRGDLHLTGDVTLNGALLFVDGDLDVVGNLRGRGALVVTGKASFSGVQDLSSDNELAILVGKDLSLQGQGVDVSRVQGLLYAEGDVEIHDGTVQGTLISHSDSGTAPRVTLDRANVVYDPRVSSLSTALNSDLVKPTASLSFNRAGYVTAPIHDLVSASAGGPADTGLNAPATVAASASQATVSAPQTDAGSNLDSMMLEIGLAMTSEGEFVLFPPGGGPPIISDSVDAAVLDLGRLVIEAFPELATQDNGGQDGTPWYNQPETTQNLRRQLRSFSALTPNDKRISTSQALLEIDPMKFVGASDYIRIRAMRVIESSEGGQL